MFRRTYDFPEYYMSFLANPLRGAAYFMLELEAGDELDRDQSKSLLEVKMALIALANIRLSQQKGSSPAFFYNHAVAAVETAEIRDDKNGIFLLRADDISDIVKVLDQYVESYNREHALNAGGLLDGYMSEEEQDGVRVMHLLDCLFLRLYGAPTLKQAKQSSRLDMYWDNLPHGPSIVAGFFGYDQGVKTVLKANKFRT